MKPQNPETSEDIHRRDFTVWMAKGGLGLGLGGLSGCVSMPTAKESLNGFLGDLSERLSATSAEPRDKYRDALNTPAMKEEAHVIFELASRKEIGSNPLEGVRTAVSNFSQTANALLKDVEGGAIKDLNKVLERLSPDMVGVMREIHDVTSSLDIKSGARKNPRSELSLVRNGSVFELPPYSAFTYVQKGYCMDPSKPAPQKGDGMELWHVSQRIPKQLIPLFQSLGTWTAQSPENQAYAQRLTWALMGAGNEGGWAATIDPKSLSLLNQIHPNGAKIFADYHNANVMAKRLINKVIEKSGIERYTGRIDLNNPQATNAAANDLLEDLVREGRKYTSNGIPGHSLINDGVAAQSIGEGSLEARVIIINSTGQTKQVDLQEWFNQPTVNKQGVSTTGIIRNVAQIQVSGEKKPINIEKLRELIWSFNQDAIKVALNKKLEGLQNYSPAAEASLKKINDKARALMGISLIPKAVVNVVKTGAGLTPLLGNALSFYEAVTGKDWLSGHSLTPLERAWAVVGSVPGGTQLRAIASGARSAGLLGKAAHLADSEIFKLTEKVTQNKNFVSFKEVNDWLWSGSVGGLSETLIPKDQNILGWNQSAKNENNTFQSLIIDLPLPWQNNVAKPILRALKGTDG